MSDKLTLNDLITYINKEAHKQVKGCVDLNTILKNNIKTSLDKLQNKETSKINWLPKNLDSIFKINESSTKYLYNGVLETLDFNNNKGKYNDTKIINCSLYSSIITTLKHSIISETIENQEMFLSTFLKRFTNDIQSFFDNFNYNKKYDWDVNEIYDNITEKPHHGTIIKYISDYFHINIFILDIPKDELYFGGLDEYVPYKDSILLLKFDDNIFNPIFTNNSSKLFTFNDEAIKNIRKKMAQIKIYDKSTNNDVKFMEISEDLNKYLNPKTTKSKKETSKVKNHFEEHNDNDSSNKIQYLSEFNTEIDDFDYNSIETDNENTDDEIDKETKKKCKTSKKYNVDNINHKLKLKELQDIAIDLDIKISSKHNGKLKNKTKQELITDITNKLS